MTRSGHTHERTLVCFVESDDFANVLADKPASVNGFQEDDANSSLATVDNCSGDGRPDLQLPV
jgi:hypothetical protein